MVVGSPRRDEPLLLLLSSGLRTRYREDILRASMLPRGAHLQFRYGRNHLPDALWGQLSAKSLGQHCVLVAYVDAADKQQPPKLIPCRYGRLVDSEAVGRYIVLKFELEDFAYASDLDRFEKEVAATSSGKLPYWDDNPDIDKRKAFGEWVHLIPRQLTSCNADGKSEVWQSITAQIKARSDFSNEPFFYRIEELREIEADVPVHPATGVYTLSAGKTYQFRILHYDPEDKDIPLQTTNQSRWILVETEGEGLKRVSTSHLAIDSPYDVKTVEFRAHNNTFTERSLITFYRIKDLNARPTTENAVRDFDLQVIVQGNWERTLWISLFVGLLLAAQQWLTMWTTKGTLEFVPALLSLLIAMAAAIAAAFGLRKPT